jgi:hypothetical protein
MISDGNSSGEEADQEPRMLAEKCINALRLMSVDRRISELSVEIAAAERSDDVERRDRLVLEHLDLSRRRSSLLPGAEAAGTGA